MEDALFTGAYEHSIDAKNRMSIPSQIRRQMGDGEGMQRFYLVPGDRPGTLSLYPERTFIERQKNWPSPDLPHEDLLNYRQIFFSMATLLEVDKQGRVLLPERPLRHVGIGREVYITGDGDHLDLWNREDYERFFEDNWSRYSEIQHRARRYFQRRPAAGDEDD